MWVRWQVQLRRSDAHGLAAVQLTHLQRELSSGCYNEGITAFCATDTGGLCREAVDDGCQVRDRLTCARCRTHHEVAACQQCWDALFLHGGWFQVIVLPQVTAQRLQQWPRVSEEKDARNCLAKINRTMYPDILLCMHSDNPT